MTLEATPIIKNKFWIVEEQGQKIATIQSTDRGFVLVKDDQREAFINFKSLRQKYDIKVVGSPPKRNPIQNNIYDFPTDSKPYNVIYDLKKKLPYYTKTAKSKSYYCAGYYAVNIANRWRTIFCPKSITVKRYKFFGPYRTEQEAESAAEVV